MKKSSGHVYLVVKRSHKWFWRPRFGRTPATHWNVHWLRLYVAAPR